MSNPPESTCDALLEGVDPKTGHKGVEILLRILGALLIGYLVNQSRSIILYLYAGSMTSTVSTDLKWVVIAFAFYLANVFRQIHGMAVVVSDETYINFAKKLRVSEQMVGLLGLIMVILVPCLFGLFVQLTLPQSFDKLGIGQLVNPDDSVKQTLLNGGCDARYMLYAYLLTAFAYVLWDLVTLRFFLCGKSKISNGERSRWWMIRRFLIFAISISSGCFGFYSFGIVGCVVGLVIGFMIAIPLLSIMETFSRDNWFFRILIMFVAYFITYKCANSFMTISGKPGHSIISVFAAVIIAVMAECFLEVLCQYKGKIFGKIWQNTFDATKYKHFIINWLILLIVTLAFGLGVIYLGSEHNGKWLGFEVKTPTVGQDMALYCVCAVCGFYTTLDYLINRHFYFSKNSSHENKR